MKIYKSLLILVFFHISYICRADYIIDYQLLDTIIVYNGINYRVQTIPRQEYDSLASIYQKLPKEVRRIEDIKKILGRNYKIYYTTYSEINSDTGDSIYGIYELRYKNKMRIFISENEGVQGYYPDLDILVYSGGHQTDNAFYVRSGKIAYNPYYSAFSPDGKFGLTGLYNGQDNVEYSLVYRENGDYKLLCNPVNILGQIPYEKVNETYWGYLYGQFWSNTTLYICSAPYNDERDMPLWYLAITPNGILPPKPTWQKGVYIADPVFREYCLRNFDADKDGAISEQEAESVREINIEGNSKKYTIDNLFGIKYFKNLIRLNCCNNQIRTLDLMGLEKLEYLNCSRNKISELWLDYCEQLREVNCSYNRLANLDLENCPALEILDGKNNRIYNINLSYNKKLISVDLLNNESLESIYLSKHKKIINLYKPENTKILLTNN